MHGRLTLYYGQLYRICFNAVDGLKHGLEIYHRTDGYTLVLIEYTRDVPSDIREIYYKNGIKKIKNRLKNEVIVTSYVEKPKCWCERYRCM